jgi:hypothetical protein
MSHASRMTGERGAVTVWILGLSIILLFLGGFSVDLWRAFTERRVLAGMADGAVVVGATAINTDVWRATGVVELEPTEAQARMNAYLLGHPEWDPAMSATINPAPDGVLVRLEQDVDFTLLRVLLPGEEPFRVGVTASAEPVLRP